MNQFYLYDRPELEISERRENRDYLIRDAQGRAVGIKVEESMDFKLFYISTRPLLEDSYTLYISDFSGHELSSFPAEKEGTFRLVCPVENTLPYGVYRLEIRGEKDIAFKGMLSVG